MHQLNRKVKPAVRIGFVVALVVSIAVYVHRLHLGDDIAQLGEKTFVLLKTGVEVMDQRVPVHLATTFKWFPSHEIYAEVDTPVLGHPVVNAISYLPAEAFEDKELSACLVRYRAIDEQWGWGASNIIVNDKKIGWYVDVFKNVPAYAHAWLKDNTKDWYAMFDDDTYMLPSTLAQAVEGKNPNDVIYLGRNLGQQPSFGYGGSGIVFSRGAMKAMFGTTKESAQAGLLDSMHLAYGWCCGDAVICYLLSEKHDEHHFRDHMEFHDDAALFQGCPLDEFISTFRHWCDPIGSFHHSKGGDYDLIARWYERLRLERGKNYRPTYFDYYEEFTLPHVAEEVPDWKAFHSSEFGDGKSLTDVTSKEDCKEKCRLDTACFQWSFQEGGDCNLIINGVVPGMARNKYLPGWNGKPSTVGYMVERILEKRLNSALTCDPINHGELPEERTEGWLLRLTADGPIPPKLNSLLDM